MWNSNSVIAWLITRSGLSTETIHPPGGVGALRAGTRGSSWLDGQQRGLELGREVAAGGERLEHDHGVGDRDVLEVLLARLERAEDGAHASS